MSQVKCALASISIFRCPKRHCCAPPIMIDARDGPTLSRQRLEHTNTTNQARGIPASAEPAFASRAGSANALLARRGFPSARQRHSRAENCARPRTIAARRDRLSRWPGPARARTTRHRLDRGHAKRNGPRIIVNNEEERFSGNKHDDRIPAAIDRRHGRDAARNGTRCRRNRSLAHHLGLSGPARHHDTNRLEEAPTASSS